MLRFDTLHANEVGHRTGRYKARLRLILNRRTKKKPLEKVWLWKEISHGPRVCTVNVVDHMLQCGKNEAFTWQIIGTVVVLIEENHVVDAIAAMHDGGARAPQQPAMLSL